MVVTLFEEEWNVVVHNTNRFGVLIDRECVQQNSEREGRQKTILLTPIASVFW